MLVAGAAVASFSMPSVPSQPSDPAMQRNGLAPIADTDDAEHESGSHESSSAHQVSLGSLSHIVPDAGLASLLSSLYPIAN